jgi:predicted outer membrane repeat protein
MYRLVKLIEEVYMKQLIIIFLLIIITGLGAVTINVPEDYVTIQSAINVAVDGDRVLVAPGTYLENINFNGKAITVTSWYCTTQDTSYISQTVIDGNEELNVVQLSSNSKLSGFTIRNGYAYCGAGILCLYVQDSILEALVIENNVSPQWGGGIYCRYSSLSINNIIVSDNYADDAGGGIYSQDSDYIIEYKFTDCDPKMGYDKEVVLLKVNNLSSSKILITSTSYSKDGFASLAFIAGNKMVSSFSK